MANNDDLRILIQDRGISATHPIILKKINDKIIVCSVADERKKFNKKFNYSILFDEKEFPFNGTKEEIMNYIIQKEFHLESKQGHDLALKSGLSHELLHEIKDLAKK